MAGSKPTTVEEYIAALEPWQQEIASSLHSLITSAAPGATASIKWAQPVYESNGPFAYFKASKKHITFGLWRGTELADPDGVLEGESDRMKHMKISSVGEIKKKTVQGFVKEAVRLNAAHGNPTRQAMKKRGEA